MLESLQRNRYADESLLFIYVDGPKPGASAETLAANAAVKKVVREKILKSNLDACIFENLNPAQYYLKIIFDENNNEKWDTGNFLNKVFPEKIYHYDEKIIIRANWILEEKIILEDE